GVFAVLSPERRKALADSGVPIQLAKGDGVFKRGDASDAAYAIITGEVEVTVDGLDGRSVFLARLGAGTVLGEMGILDGSPRSADAHATRRTELWRIDRKLVTDAMMAEPGA